MISVQFCFIYSSQQEAGHLYCTVKTLQDYRETPIRQSLYEQHLGDSGEEEQLVNTAMYPIIN